MPRPRYGLKRKFSAAPSSYNAKRPRVGGFAARPRPLVPIRRPYAPVEVKAVDFQGNLFFSNDATSNNQINLINSIAQGTGPFQRIGRRANMKSIQLKFEIQNYTIAAPPDRLRVAIVMDMHPDGLVPAFNTIFQNTDNSGTASSGVDSGPNLDQSDRFRILYTRTFNTPTIAGSGGGVVQGNLDVNRITGTFFKKLNQSVLFKSGGHTIGDIQAGAIYVISESDTSTLASQNWILKMNSRLRYTD